MISRRFFYPKIKDPAPGNVSNTWNRKYKLLFICILQENIFQDKQHCKYIHQCADLLFFCLACDQVDGYVCDNSHGDTFGNAVEERHCDDTYITWNCFGHVAEVDADYVAEHVQTNDYQCRSCGKGWDCQEDRGQEQGQTK